jgi:hypothetical protein
VEGKTAGDAYRAHSRAATARAWRKGATLCIIARVGKGGIIMKIHAPSETVFWAAAALLALALIGHFAPEMGFLTRYQFWFAVSSGAVMLLGCVV